MSQELYRALTKRIQEGYRTLKTDNSFYQSIWDASVQPTAVSALLKNLSYLVTFTPPHLKLAAERSRQLGWTKLAEFFEHKVAEEDGHDIWGEDDVKNIGMAKKNEVKAIDVTPEMIAFTKANEAMIFKNPYYFFVYVLWAEYYTVIAAPEVMSRIEKACGIPKEFMSILGNHAELDKEHVHEWAEEAKAIGNCGVSLEEQIAVLDDIFVRYNAFCHGLSTRYANKAA